MATIGFSTESGAVHSVLWDTSEARVVEHDALPGVSDEWAETSLNTAVDDLSSEGYSIDAVGVVCAQDSEKARIWALDGRPATVVPIAAALLEWMDASGHFTDQQHVLLYVVDDDQVRMSLVDRTAETLSDARVTTVDAKSAEKFGATVPVAWDVLDHADVEADSVALFAEPSDEALLKPILELGLGKPVVRIDSYGTSIAHGAALVAARTGAPAPVPVVPPEPAPVAAVVAETPAPVAAPVAEKSGAAWMHSRRNLVLAGVLLLGVLSGGVALAATLPSSSTPEPAPVPSVSGPVAGAAPSAETPNVPSVGEPVQVPAVAAPVSAPGPVPPPAVAPIAAPVAPAAAAPVAAAPWTNTAPAAVAPPRATSAASAPATTIDPPVFEVPPIVPDPSDPSKSQAELQQEAWDRHWEHTAEWLDQELELGQ